MMTDPIADLLTRIRNGLHAKKHEVSLTGSKIKVDIVEILKDEGFIKDYKVTSADGGKSTLYITLKYGSDGEKVINHLERISKPSCRRYLHVKDITRVLNGMGISILSTPRGVLSNRQAKKENVGGEIICKIW